MRLLLIEDNTPLRHAISQYLREAGYLVDTSATGDEGLWAADGSCHDLILLDLMLPNLDGTEILRQLRAKQNPVHIIVISARDGLEDRLEALDAGADDYLVKPFSMKELVARCKVGLRRLEAQIDGPAGYRDENFEIEFDAYVLRYKGEEIRLTHKEFELVRYMVERAGRVLTRERLLDRVWGHDTEVDARSIDAHVRRLRAKLGPARRHVETVVGIGYRFVR